eukprot:CAMPEP_0170541184 /NCGR_PEP_ID=MMETSP0211-20121228/989_1 /TAXON_ID=311385 /ORGANISM="Pseudokeronopsis sp., Strain OXSARD2" /LENGTH=196 /DNA_ID=CAMNT_0010843823 /DNA_START=19 /DNA_END=610 /DNA_ORIENTATION=+
MGVRVSSDFQSPAISFNFAETEMTCISFDYEEVSARKIALNGLRAREHSWAVAVHEWVSIVSDPHIVVVSLFRAAVSSTVNLDPLDVSVSFHVNSPPLPVIGKSDSKPIGVLNVVIMKQPELIPLMALKGAVPGWYKVLWKANFPSRRFSLVEVEDQVPEDPEDPEDPEVVVEVEVDPDVEVEVVEVLVVDPPLVV